jgi:signal transduction histidine kinase
MKLTITQRMILIASLSAISVVCSIAATLQCYMLGLSQVFSKEMLLIITCLLACAVSTLVSCILCRNILGSIDTFLICARQLAAGNLSLRIIRNGKQHDELGELAQQFNLLAASIELKDQAQRKWLTDTSHELRTPLAILRAQIEALQDGVQEANEQTLSVLHKEVLWLSHLMDIVHESGKAEKKEFAAGTERIQSKVIVPPHKGTIEQGESVLGGMRMLMRSPSRGNSGNGK